MSHSPEVQESLLARIPQVTGHDLRYWYDAMVAGPGLIRPEERIRWLEDEHSLPHAYAKAIVHEVDRRRAARLASVS